jgi:hypothetical protein
VSDDRDQIENLLARYCLLFDQGELEEFSRLFEHGRVIASDGRVFEGPEGVRRNHEERTTFYPDGKPHTAHVISNILIEISEDGTSASSSCYFTIFQGLPDFPLQPISVGRYLDRFARSDRTGPWRWIERRAIADMIGDAGHHAPHLRRT